MSDLEARLREQLAELASSVAVDTAGPSRHRRSAQRLTTVVIGLLVLALAGGIAYTRLGNDKHVVTGPGKPRKTTTTITTKIDKSLPTVTASGATARSRWQLDGLDEPTVIDDEVVGFLGLGDRPVIRAVSALDGTTRWTVPLPAAQPGALGLLAAQGVVVAVTGHGTPGPAGGTAAGELLVIDAPTGRVLWTQAIGGATQTPPIAIASDLVVTGDPLGNLNARNASTGVRAWHLARPAACPRAGVVQYDEALAADGPLLAVSYQCSMPTSRRSLIERLDLASGATTWTFATPDVHGPLGNMLNAIGAVSTSNTVFVSGPLPTVPSFVGAFGRSVTWPSSLARAGQGTVVSLDATTGDPRWNELGNDMYSFVQFGFTDGAVCESMAQGFECRDDVTGAPTRPVFSSGYAQGFPSFGSDGFAALSGNTAAAVEAAPSSKTVQVDVVPVRGNGPVAKITIGISTTIFNGANQSPFVVGGGQLPDGSALLFIRRIDVSGHPILAVSVNPHH